MPKMIKIGEIRVLNYFDLPWNEPKMKKLEQNSLIRSILKLVLLPTHKTRGMTPYGAVEKNWGFSGGL